MSERLSYDFALTGAKLRGNRRASPSWRGWVCPPPHTLSAMRTKRGWMSRFGGDIYTTPTTSDLLLEVLQADEFYLLDFIKLVQGSRFSAKQIDLSSSVLSFDVPMLFLLGRHDRVVPGALAAANLERLSALCKKLV